MTPAHGNKPSASSGPDSHHALQKILAQQRAPARCICAGNAKRASWPLPSNSGLVFFFAGNPPLPPASALQLPPEPTPVRVGPKRAFRLPIAPLPLTGRPFPLLACCWWANAFPILHARERRSLVHFAPTKILSVSVWVPHPPVRPLTPYTRPTTIRLTPSALENDPPTYVPIGKYRKEIGHRAQSRSIIYTR